MFKYLFLFSFFSIVSIGSLLGQSGEEKGTIKGQIIDKESGEVLIGATIYVKEKQTGAVTDLNGRYKLQLEPGNYTLEISYVSYAKKIINNVKVEAGKTVDISVGMESDLELQEVVVEAETVKNTDIALVRMQKKSFEIQDGISVGQMKALGLSNAAESLKQVTGASVEDNKYLVMRGLGDRYSLSMLDGIILPSIEPYRNSTSMDLVPADMIDNVIIKKTFSPDMPGNFAGGLAEIQSKSIPEDFYLSAGISIGYNENATFNNNFRRDAARGSLDFLGFDDGTRSLPDPVQNNLQELRNANSLAIQGRTDPEARETLNSTAKAFETEFIPESYTPPLNHGLDVSFGNRFELGEKGIPLGINVGINYDRSFSNYSGGEFNTFETNTDAEGNFSPNPARLFDMRNSSEDVKVGNLIGFSIQPSPNHEFSIRNLYNHIGSFGAVSYEGKWPEAISSREADFSSFGVTYREKSMNFTALSGEHNFKDAGDLNINWTVAYNTNQQNEPDLRYFAYVEDGGEFAIRRSETAGDPRRFFRELNDNQVTGRFDIERPFRIFNREWNFKTGAYASYKERQFDELYFDIPLTNQNLLNPNYVTFGDANGNFNQFFSNDNFGYVSTPQDNGTNRYGIGNYYVNRTVPSNQYTGSQLIAAGYLMTAFDLWPTLKVVGGMRVERTDLLTENNGPDSINVRDPLDPNNNITVTSDGDIEVTDFLPALNLIYKITENTNLRGAFSQTVARPNMREISPFRSLGSIGADIVIGNPQLNRTKITNYDLRFETYMKPGELFAVSAYYKSFNDPIIVNIYSTGSAIEQQPNNVDNAFVYGAEIEYRRNLAFIPETLGKFKFGANATVIYSRVAKPDRELSQIEGFQGAESVQQDWRPFQGQSPYIFNANIIHELDSIGLETSFNFNIFGPRLSYQTPAQIPDVYEQPRPSLNFKTSKTIGKKFSLSFGVKNIFDMQYLKTFDFEVEGVSNVYQSYRLGRTYSLGLSYSFD